MVNSSTIKSWITRTAALAPGLIAASFISLLADCLRTLPYLSVVSPMMLAMLIGLTLNNVVGQSALLRDGILFSQRRLLRIAIVLLGLQLTFAEISRLGTTGLAILVAGLASTFVFTVHVARLLGVEEKLAKLIAAGTCVCGASAVVAANAVLRGKEEDVTYAVASVTIFGTVAMLLFPLLPQLLHLNAREFGLWTGSSVHEVAQVVAASFQHGQIAGEMGTIAKLSRVMMLAPLVLAMGLLSRGRDQAGTETPRRAPAAPWFVFGFVAATCINSIVTIPVGLKSNLIWLTTFLLTAALAAMGMHTDLSKLRSRGFRPALLGSLASLFIGVFSVACIKLLY
ncbi:YeiH family protein [Bradyrhizobium iriomotense]|uniref:YeiH family protein n=1 Tax=Bradyrhizobium iriomotense TaxID=441950 RepID=UPI001B8A5579|nr:putative sulfate exporter family transporter [Bradyrhizobium iriomotense]MBR1130835.1 putative sulfate exporter family transporter [Bradyrhizobium iriomotense]